MITRQFSVAGVSFLDGQQLAMCTPLRCLAVEATVAAALATLTTQVARQWTTQLAPLRVLIAVDAVLTTAHDPRRTDWSAVVRVRTNETATQGIAVERRLALDWDEQVVTNLLTHLRTAAALDAYVDVMAAIAWYVMQPAFPASLRPALGRLHDRAVACCRVLRDERQHFRYTRPYRQADVDRDDQSWN